MSLERKDHPELYKIIEDAINADFGRDMQIIRLRVSHEKSRWNDRYWIHANLTYPEYNSKDRADRKTMPDDVLFAYYDTTLIEYSKVLDIKRKRQ